MTAEENNLKEKNDTLKGRTPQRKVQKAPPVMKETLIYTYPQSWRHNREGQRNVAKHKPKAFPLIIKLAISTPISPIIFFPLEPS